MYGLWNFLPNYESTNINLALGKLTNTYLKNYSNLRAFIRVVEQPFVECKGPLEPSYPSIQKIN